MTFLVGRHHADLSYGPVATPFGGTVDLEEPIRIAPTQFSRGTVDP